jgi:Transposase DDE domain group 1
VQNTVRRLKFVVTDDGKGIVSHGGAALLMETAGLTGLQSGLSQGLERWRLPRSVHDPGKVALDLAVAVAVGGDCTRCLARTLVARWALIASLRGTHSTPALAMHEHAGRLLRRPPRPHRRSRYHKDARFADASVCSALLATTRAT